MTFYQWLQEQLLNAAVTTALLGFAAYLLRTTISERIKRAVGHEYDAKLETLRTSNAKFLDEMRSARAEREAFRAMAMAMMTSTQTGTMDKRIAAIDILWRSLHELRECVPPMIWVLDMVGWDATKLGREGMSTINNLDFLKILSPNVKSISEVAKNRPFLGDQLYSRYHATQAIHGRAISTTIASHQQNKFRYWFQEQDTIELLKSILTAEELSRFNEMTHNKLDWLYRTMEAKIVLEIQRELSGAPAAEDTLQQANRILEQAAAVVQTAAHQPVS